MIAEVFKDRELCNKEIMAARKVMTGAKATKQTWEAMETSLALMFIYCPKDMQGIVQATLTEAEMRKPLEYVQ